MYTLHNVKPHAAVLSSFTSSRGRRGANTPKEIQSDQCSLLQAEVPTHLPQQWKMTQQSCLQSNLQRRIVKCLSSSTILLLYYCHLLEDLTAEVFPEGGFLEPEKHKKEKEKVGMIVVSLL